MFKSKKMKRKFWLNTLMQIAKISLFLQCVLAAAACTAPRGHLRVPPPLESGGETLLVEGRQRLLGPKLRFGGYRVENLVRSFRKLSIDRPSVFNGRQYQAKKQQRMAFTLTSTLTASVLNADCVNRSLEQQENARVIRIEPGNISSGLESGATQRRGEFICSLKSELGEVARLELVSLNRASFSGTVTGSRLHYAVSASDESVDEPFGQRIMAGYYVLKGDEPVAMVDILHAGRVALSRNCSAEDRLILSTVAAALLLFPDLR